MGNPARLYCSETGPGRHETMTRCCGIRIVKRDEPLLLDEYYDDMLYYRMALNIPTVMYQRQRGLADSLSTTIEVQYAIRVRAGT